MLKKTEIKIFLILSLLTLGLYLFLGNKKTNAGDFHSTIRAAIIPHHLVAKDFMSDLGNRLSITQPPQLIIIGPNHNEVGNSHLLTDNEALSDSKKGILTTDIVNVNKDHACYAPRGVLEKSLPQTKFSCILISNRTSSSEISALAQLLKNYLKNNDVLVASVDFSHYLPLRTATDNDQITWSYLKNFNTSALLKLKNGYLDSPKTVAVLFEYLHFINALNFSQIKHSNSAQIQNIPDSASTTSYFEVVYW